MVIVIKENKKVMQTQQMKKKNIFLVMKDVLFVLKIKLMQIKMILMLRQTNFRCSSCDQTVEDQKYYFLIDTNSCFNEEPYVKPKNSQHFII